MHHAYTLLNEHKCMCADVNVEELEIKIISFIFFFEIVGNDEMLERKYMKRMKKKQGTTMITMPPPPLTLLLN